jgi:hypothetical protein
MARLNARPLIQPESIRSAVSPQRAFLDKYCGTCHNERLGTGGLMLDKKNLEHVGEGADVWEKVARKLRGRAMPPAGRPRPDPATYDAFVRY